MRRMALLIAALASLTPWAAAPAMAAEVDARIVWFTSGFRQELVDYTGVTYDPVTGVARIHLTTHCFVEHLQIAPDAPIDVGQSQVLSIDYRVTQHGRDSGWMFDGVIALDPDATLCDRDFVIPVPNLDVGAATFTVAVSQIAFHDVTTVSRFRVILPPR